MGRARGGAVQGGARDGTARDGMGGNAMVVGTERNGKVRESRVWWNVRLGRH